MRSSEPFLHGEIKQTICDLDGRNVNAKSICPHHFYVIVTRQKYNKESNFVTAVPITSKEISLGVLNYGVDLPRSEIAGDFKLDEDVSYILYDRLCRLNINQFKQRKGNFIPEGCTRLNDKAYKLLMDRLYLFLKFGKKKE